MTFEGTAELDFEISSRFLRKIVRETLVFCDVLFHLYTYTHILCLSYIPIHSLSEFFGVKK